MRCSAAATGSVAASAAAPRAGEGAQHLHQWCTEWCDAARPADRCRPSARAITAINYEVHNASANDAAVHSSELAR